MASNSHRKSGSSARSTNRKRVVIGAADTSRVTYKKKERAKVEPLRRHAERDTSAVGDHASRRAGEAGRRVSKTKRDERAVRQRAIGTRRMLMGVAAAVAAVLVVLARVGVARAPIFPVRSIVVTGAKRLTSAQVLRRASIPAGTTLLRVNAKAVENAVKADPWVADAKLVRHFPGALELRVTERTPAAIVDAGGTKLWLVDGQGVWLAKASSVQTSTLPSIRDIESLTPTVGMESASVELRNALQVWQGLSPELRAQVRTISAPTVDRTVLLLPHGVQVFVGSSEDIAKKDEAVRSILSKNKNVVYVNVRVLRATTYRNLKTLN
jgi:cell division protein FtsQ